MHDRHLWSGTSSLAVYWFSQRTYQLLQFNMASKWGDRSSGQSDAYLKMNLLLVLYWIIFFTCSSWWGRKKWLSSWEVDPEWILFLCFAILKIMVYIFWHSCSWRQAGQWLRVLEPNWIGKALESFDRSLHLIRWPREFVFFLFAASLNWCMCDQPHSTHPLQTLTWCVPSIPPIPTEYVTDPDSSLASS